MGGVAGRTWSAAARRALQLPASAWRRAVDELYSYRQVRGVVLHSYWQAGGVFLRQERLHAVYAVQSLSTV